MKKLRSIIKDVIDFLLYWVPLAAGVVGIVFTAVVYILGSTVPLAVIVWGVCYLVNDYSAAKFTERTGIVKVCTTTLQCYIKDGGKTIPYDTWVLQGDSTKIDVKHLTGDTNGDERTEGQENR